jgi:EAL domain-containing protein (putative c-di-GMP-specific phosphodiesterase class I)/GGDEF domain-containing protein
MLFSPNIIVSFLAGFSAIIIGTLANTQCQKHPPSTLVWRIFQVILIGLSLWLAGRFMLLATTGSIIGLQLNPWLIIPSAISSLIAATVFLNLVQARPTWLASLLMTLILWLNNALILLSQEPAISINPLQLGISLLMCFVLASSWILLAKASLRKKLKQPRLSISIILISLIMFGFNWLFMYELRQVKSDFAIHLNTTLVLILVASFLALFIRTIAEKNTLQSEKLDKKKFFDLMSQSELEHLLKKMHKRLRHKKIHLVLMVINLDDFKKIYYLHGQNQQNSLLSAVAKRLNQMLQNTQNHQPDTSVYLAYYMGDQFHLAILSSNNTEIDYKPWAKGLISCFHSPFHVNGQAFSVRATIGISIADSFRDFSVFLHQAQIALYHGKQLGKMRYQLYNSTLDQNYQRSLRLENDLQKSLENHEFILHFQAQHDLHTQRLHGFEVLLRWQHPELGLISPEEFIPVAERSNLIQILDEWVLTETAKQITAWATTADWRQDLVIAVNVTPREWMNPELQAFLSDLFKTYPHFIQQAELELTESAFIIQYDYVRNLLQWLRQQGLRLSLDDFGTGYSSLSRIHDFPIDTIKIDKSFIINIADDVLQQEIVETIIELAKSLKLSTIAEGVETIEQAHYLTKLGCQYGQGYLYSKAIPGTEVLDYIRQSN